MVNINLIPEEVLKARKDRQSIARIIRISSIIIVVMVIVLGVIFYTRMLFQSNLADLAEQRIEVKTEIEAYDRFRIMNSDISSKSQAVSAAVGVQPDWDLLMAGFSEKIPANVWLSTLSFSYNYKAEKSHGEVNIRGTTYDHPSTASWWEKIGEIAGLSDPYCSFSIAENVAGSSDNVIVFEIKASLNRGKAFEPLAGGEE